MDSQPLQDEKFYALGFSLLGFIGPTRFQLLKKHFSSLAQAWRAGLESLQAAGLEMEIAQRIALKRPEIDLAKEWQKLESENIQVLTQEDEAYPALLKEIYHPPFLLYVKGHLPINNPFFIAIVGSRKMSDYGKRVAADLARDLAVTGAVIVSGLALGIDSVVHEEALNVNGQTIAVLGSGINREHIYPSSNRELTEKIIASGRGAVLSELPWGTLPLKQNFPNRNRIIAGLCLATIVVEAATDSGALITAEQALEQNREVFAVPGSIYSPLSTGCNDLLKRGAKLATSAQDVLEDLNIQDIHAQVTAVEIIPENENERTIFSILQPEPVHINELIRQSRLSSPEVIATLTVLEIKGVVRNLGGNKYVKARS